MVTKAPFIALILLPSISGVPVARAQVGPSRFSQTELSIDSRPDLIVGRESQIRNQTAGYSVTIDDRIVVKRSLHLLQFTKLEREFVNRVDLSHFGDFLQSAEYQEFGNPVWRIHPAHLISLASLDGDRFTKENYTFKFKGYAKWNGKQCMLYRVRANPNARSLGQAPFLDGSIWVDISDFTIIHFQGHYDPSSRLVFPLTESFWFAFEFSRVEIAPQVWVLGQLTVTNGGRNRDPDFPEFEADITFRNFTRQQVLYGALPR